jgi:hypothetical protein
VEYISAKSYWSAELFALDPFHISASSLALSVLPVIVTSLHIQWFHMQPSPRGTQLRRNFTAEKAIIFPPKVK